jgi:hypothetical protein
MSFAERAKAKAKQAAGEVMGDDKLKREGAEEERAAGERRASATEGGTEMASERVGPGQSKSPVSDTIHNLVQTLSVKLDSAHRYGLYQEDAVREGHDDCAQVFADIAERERETIDRLLRCLEERLGGGIGHEAARGAGAQAGPAVAGERGEPGAHTGFGPTAPGGPGGELGGPQSPRNP